jgi:hypothetical protein
MKVISKTKMHELGGRFEPDHRKIPAITETRGAKLLTEQGMHIEEIAHHFVMSNRHAPGCNSAKS